MLLNEGLRFLKAVSAVKIVRWRPEENKRARSLQGPEVNANPVATTTPRGLPARGPRSAPGSVFVLRSRIFAQTRPVSAFSAVGR